VGAARAKRRVVELPTDVSCDTSNVAKLPRVSSVGSVAIALSIFASPPMWSAPEGCPTQQKVEAMLGEEHRDVPPEVVASSSVQADVSRGEDHTWRVSVVVQTSSGRMHREFQLDSCEAAAEATALVYGLALTQTVESDAASTQPAGGAPQHGLVPAPEASAPKSGPGRTPTLGSEETHPEHEIPPLESDRVPGSSRHAAPVPAAQAANRPRRGAVFVGTGLRALAIPRATVMVLAGGELRLGPFRIGAGADYAFVRRFDVPQMDARGELSTLLGSLTVGFPVPWPVVVTPNLAVRGGAVYGQGHGGSTSNQRWKPWWLVAVGVDASWPPRSRWAVRAAASFEVPLVRHVFTFGESTLATTGRVGLRAWVGPLVRFGV